MEINYRMRISYYIGLLLFVRVNSERYQGLALICNGQLEPTATLSASSIWPDAIWSHDVTESCLDNININNVQTGAWSSHHNDVNQWLMVQFDDVYRLSSIVTQGRPVYSNQFVRTYQLSYSTNGMDWVFMTDDSGNNILFQGNTDRDTKVENSLDCDINAKYLKLFPVTWNEHISMRWEIYGFSATSMTGSIFSKTEGQRAASGISITIVTSSDIGCSIKCLKQSDCVAFNYNRIAHTCEFVNINVPTLTNTGNDWGYYLVKCI